MAASAAARAASAAQECSTPSAPASTGRIVHVDQLGNDREAAAAVRSGGEAGAGTSNSSEIDALNKQIDHQRGPRRHGRQVQRRRSGRSWHRELGRDRVPHQ